MSNLLEKASIILTPTAYNNGEALCIKPEDGSGDFDFSRNSAATRVNAQGLVENVQTISGNLLDYSTFTSPSASWSLVGGLWVFDDTANGFILTPNIAVVVGDVFDVVVDVTIASGNANFRYASGNAQTTLFPFTDFVDGVNEFQATITGVDGFLQRIFAPASLTDNPFTLNSISIKKISQDTNLPRINYEGGCGSWLFEPQSTNLVFQSNTLTAISGGVVTPNAAISPDGTTNAIKVNFSTGVNSGGTISIGGSSAAASTEYTFSFYAKNFSGDGTFRLRLDTDTQATLVNEDFTATSDWVRYTHTFTTDAAASSFGSSSRFRNDTDNNEVLFFGMQLEQQSYATSYIPTEGSTVTRNQDVCNNGGSLASIGSSEGVLYFEGSALVDGGSNRIISLSDETNDNLVQFRFDTTAGRITSFIRGNGGSYAIKTINGFTQANNNKVALVWNATNLRVWINGTESGSVSTNDLPIGMDTFSFTQPTGGASTFFGKTKAVAVWKESLSDSELQSLTTI
jgi:hypothetical protein